MLERWDRGTARGWQLAKSVCCVHRAVLISRDDRPTDASSDKARKQKFAHDQSCTH